MYIAENHHASGAGSVSNTKLRTITGDLDVALNGILDYTALSSVGGDVTVHESATVTVTQAHFPSVGFTTDGTSIILPNATHVKVGEVLPATVTLDKAVHFASSYSGAAQTTSTIHIGGADAVFSIAATTFTGPVSINTTGAATLLSVTSAAALDVVATDIDLSNMTTFTGATTLSATTINIGSMESSTATVTLVGPTAVDLPNLESLGGNFIAASAATFSAEELATSTGTIHLKAGATVELLSLTQTSTTGSATLVNGGDITELTLTGQATSLIIAAYGHLTELNYTGKKPATATPGSQVAINNLTVTSANASLTSLVIGVGGIGTLTVSDSTLTTLNTAGVIINTIVTNNASLTTFGFNHTFRNGDDATVVSVVDNDNPGFTELNLGSLGKVKHVNITGNTSLTTIHAPRYGATELAEPLATVTVTINNNDLSGTYRPAVAGSETSSYTMATATSAEVTSFKPFIEAYLAQTRTATVVWDISVDSQTATQTTNQAFTADTDGRNGPDGITGNADDQVDNVGGVNTVKELELF
jgi:hypothetical protein